MIDRVKIIEHLPLDLYNDITEFLSQISSYEKEVLTIGESKITIDASLFDATTAT